MLVLALDSSTPTLSLAAFETDTQRPVLERAIPPGQAHSALLPGAIQDLLAACGASLGALRGIATGLGPGSFTGLRIGLATAKGLCYVQRVPLLGVSSLRAMAAEASGHANHGTLLVPCIHARRNEVYAGFYTAGSLEEASPEVACPPTALAEKLRTAKDAVLFGNGRLANAATFSDLAPSPADFPDTPKAAFVARLVSPWGDFDLAALFALEPHYIRASEAEMKFPHGLTGPGVASSRVQASRKLRKRR